MQEYKQLKDKLLDNTRKSGSAIGLYFLLLVNGQVRVTSFPAMAASLAMQHRWAM